MSEPTTEPAATGEPIVVDVPTADPAMAGARQVGTETDQAAVDQAAADAAQAEADRLAGEQAAAQNAADETARLEAEAAAKAEADRLAAEGQPSAGGSDAETAMAEPDESEVADTSTHAYVPPAVDEAPSGAYTP